MTILACHVGADVRVSGCEQQRCTRCGIDFLSKKYRVCRDCRDVLADLAEMEAAE